MLRLSSSSLTMPGCGCAANSLSDERARSSPPRAGVDLTTPHVILPIPADRQTMVHRRPAPLRSADRAGRRRRQDRPGAELRRVAQRRHRRQGHQHQRRDGLPAPVLDQGHGPDGILTSRATKRCSATSALSSSQEVASTARCTRRSSSKSASSTMPTTATSWASSRLGLWPLWADGRRASTARAGLHHPVAGSPGARLFAPISWAMSLNRTRKAPDRITCWTT